MEKKTNKINKKGQMGLDTGKLILFSVLFLAVTGFVMIVLLGSLVRTPVAVNSGTIPATTETVTGVAEIARPFTVTGFTDCSITVSSAMNQTGGNTIPASNYTVSGCTIRFNTAQGNANGYNNTNWVINYSGTFNSFGSVNNNVTIGTSGFFAQTGTWFALLGVAIIILIIGVVIFAVQRFGARNQSGF